MAPPAPNGFEYRSQILENCAFFSHRKAQLSVITAKQPLGDAVSATVLRIENGQREVLLSATASLLQEAMQELHNKSMEAVQHHILTYGYALVRNIKTKSARAGNDDDDDGSACSDLSASFTVALSDGASSSASSSESDTASSVADKHSSKAKKAKKHGRKAKREERKSRKDRRSRSRSRSSSESRSRSRSRSTTRSRSPPPWRPGPRIGGRISPMRVLPTHLRPVAAMARPQPPLPPPGVRISSGPAFPPVRTTPNAAPTPTPTLQPTPTPGTTGAFPPPQMLLKDVRLHVQWIGHGEQRLLQQARASLRALQDVAVTYVRRNSFAFQAVTTADTMPAKLWALRASVKQAHIEGQTYDLSNYTGDDLTKLIDLASTTDIPRFDIEVDSLPPGVRRISPPPPQIITVAS